MSCEICFTIRNKGLAYSRFDRDATDPSGWKQTTIVFLEKPSPEVVDGFELRWDGTVSGFESVLSTCSLCNKD